MRLTALVLVLAGCAHTPAPLRCNAMTDTDVLRGIALAEGARTFAFIEKETRLDNRVGVPIVLTRVIRYAFKDDETIAIDRHTTCTPAATCQGRVIPDFKASERTLEISGSMIDAVVGCAGDAGP